MDRLVYRFEGWREQKCLIRGSISEERVFVLHVLMHRTYIANRFCELRSFSSQKSGVRIGCMLKTCSPHVADEVYLCNRVHRRQHMKPPVFAVSQIRTVVRHSDFKWCSACIQYRHETTIWHWTRPVSKPVGQRKFEYISIAQVR